jgi:hypothetical protein
VRSSFEFVRSTSESLALKSVLVSPYFLSFMSVEDSQIGVFKALPHRGARRPEPVHPESVRTVRIVVKGPKS